MTTQAVGVLDTNIVIVLGQLSPEDLPTEPVITAITLAELSVGPLVAEDAAERAARQARLQETEAAFDPLPFDASAARAFGRVAAAVRRSGRQVRPRAFDTLIASIAIANELPLYTCNPRDYSGLEGLMLMAVPPPEAQAGAREVVSSDRNRNRVDRRMRG
ncbi:MAG: type II toxin-antitoxin system VapC family toxin [Dermatophilaceae bacterium]